MVSSSMLDIRIIEQLCQIAIEAGDAIAAVQQTTTDLNVQYKSDGSEVTAADLMSNRIVTAGIANLAMEAYPIIAEESELALTANLADYTHAWLVDPLDGTKGFIAGHPNFTVNIALIENGYPIFGVIEHPITRECIWAAAGQGAHQFSDPLSKIEDFDSPLGESELAGPLSESLRSSTLPRGESVNNGESPWRVLTGRYQNIPLWEERLSAAGPVVMQAQNSSYKFCTLAKNEADIYPRGSQISAWDTAAGQCILEEAGGAVIDFNGERLCYTGPAKSHKKHPRSGFIAVADAEQLPMWIDLFTKEGVITHDKTR